MFMACDRQFFLPNMNLINQQLPLDRIKSTFEINFFALDVPENP